MQVPTPWYLGDKGTPGRKAMRTQRQKRSPRGVVNWHWGSATAPALEELANLGAARCRESPVLASVRELLPEDAEINIDFWWLCGAWTNKNEDVRDLEHTTGHPLKTSARLGSCKEQLWDARGCLWGLVYIGVPVPRCVRLRGIRNWW